MGELDVLGSCCSFVRSVVFVEENVDLSVVGRWVVVNR